MASIGAILVVLIFSWLAPVVAKRRSGVRPADERVPIVGTDQ